MSAGSSGPGDGDPGGTTTVDADAVAALDATVARALGVAPLRLEGERLVIAGPAERARSVLRTVELLAGRPVRLVVAEAQEIERVQLSAYGAAEPPAAAHGLPLRVRGRDLAGPGADEDARYRELAAGHRSPLRLAEPARRR